MATEKQGIDLVLQTQGRDQADQLRESMEQLRAKIVQMGSSLAATDPQMIAMGKQLKDMSDQADKLDRQFGRTGSSMDRFGQVATNINYVVQDFTSQINNGLAPALGAIQNNLPNLIRSFGFSGGLASGIGLASVAVGLVLPHLDKLLKLLGGDEPLHFALEMEQIAARLKEISAQPIKLAVDFLELDEAERRLKKLKEDKLAYDALMNRRTKAETESGHQFNEVLVESEGGRAAIETVKVRQSAQSESDSLALQEMRAKRSDLVARQQELQQEQIDRPNSVATSWSLSNVKKEIDQLDKDYQIEVAKAHAAGAAIIEGYVAEAGRGNPVAQSRLIGKMKAVGASPDTLSDLQGATQEGIKARAASDDASGKWADEIDAQVQKWADDAERRRKRDKARKAGIEARDEAIHRDAARIAQLTTKQQAADAKDDAREAIADNGVVPGGHVIHRAAPAGRVLVGRGGQEAAPGSPVVLLGPNGQPLVTPPEIGSTIPDPATDPLNPKNFPKPGSQFVGSDAKRRARRAKARMSGNAARVSMARNARQRAREIAARQQADRKARRPAPKPARANLLMNANPFDLVATAQARQQAEAARVADERRKNAALGGLPDFKGLDAKARAKILADNAAQRAADPKNRFGLGGTLPPLPSDPRGDILRRGLRGLVGPLAGGEGDAMNNSIKATTGLSKEVAELKETVGELIRGYQSGQFKSRVVLN